MLGGELKFPIKPGCDLSVKAAACGPFDPLKYPMTKANVITTPSLSDLTSSLFFGIEHDPSPTCVHSFSLSATVDCYLPAARTCSEDQRVGGFLILLSVTDLHVSVFQAN